MEELKYPFDSSLILKKKRSLRKKLLNENKNYIEKKIAILSGSTIGDIPKILELFLLNNGIKPTFYEGQYNRYYEEIMFPNKDLEDFKPDLIYVHTTNKNLVNTPSVDLDVETIVNDEFERLKGFWEKIENDYNCPIIQNNFEFFPYRLLGNADGYINGGSVQFINKLNNKIYEYANNNKSLFINDINYLSNYYGLEKWFDNSVWYLYKYALSIDAIPYLCNNISNIIKSIYGKNKKALILDLDNTLWGGVIGDDGVDNIHLGIETPDGMAFDDFQKYIKELSKMGILLNVCSKNDENKAKEGFSHPSSNLKVDDFIEFKANWDEKYKNVDEIVSSLNIMPESVVFIDDNPVEREVVKSFVPNIEVLNIDKPENYVKLLDQNGFFEVTSLVDDDKKRVEFYKTNQNREKQKQQFKDYNEYLKSLDMVCTISNFNKTNIERVTQLINKTNQFNLTTIRYNQTEVEEMANDSNMLTLCARLEDKFGDNGIVTELIGKFDGKVFDINLFIMSCRVFKRNLEYAMFDEVVKICKEKGVEKIVGHYIKTAKNNLVSDFYGELGFNAIRKTENESDWEYIIPDDYKNKNNEMEVKYDE